MNKTELIAAVAEEAEMTKKDAEKAVKAVIDVIGHNPSTQKEIKIPASKAPAFRVSKQLKEKVNVVKAKKAKK